MADIRTRKTKWSQFGLLLTSIGCAVYAGVYWFVASDETECPWWGKVLGIVVVFAAAIGVVFAAKWYVWR